MAAPTAVLTRSQIEALDFGCLGDVAAYFDAVADVREEAFTDIWQATATADWKDQGRRAAIACAHDDLEQIKPAGNALREAAEVARRSAPDLAAGKRAVLYKVQDAENAGLTVGEDLSVTDRQPSETAVGRTARQAQAQAFAADIRQSVVQLTTHTQEVAGKLTTAAAGVGNIRFDESPILGIDDGLTTEGRKGSIQQVDNKTIPDGPGQPFPEKPWEYNLDLVSNGSLATDGLPSAGTTASIDDVWNELHRCFNCNFPIGGAPSAFPEVGDKLPLEMRIAGQKVANLPVQVTQVHKGADEINIEFATLPGHVDGPGSTIRFRFFRQGGELHLGICGYITEGPGSETGPVGPVGRSGYTWMAQATWQPYIDRLTTNIAKAKGLHVTALAPHRAHG